MNKFTEEYFNKRINTKLVISEEQYADCILSALQFLILDLNTLLEKENRRYGIVISYLSSIYQAYNRISFTRDNYFKEFIYLFKPLLVKEYKRLGTKHFSEADRVIIILKNLLDILVEIKDYDFEKEVKTIHKVISRLFNNIRNKRKNTPIYQLNTFIKEYMELGYVGKYKVENFSLLEEIKEKEKTVLEGTGIRLDHENNKVSEIVWKEE